MKLRTVHLLCNLCVVCTFVQCSWSNRETQTPTSNASSTELYDANNSRDKRALGLVLSGLAQVFGYTVNPVQIASLPNPNNSEARVTNSTRTNSTKPDGSATSATRQRETIRFTGVVNLGNGTDVLTQLQQYENIFHGGNGSSSSTSSPPQFHPTSDQPQPLPPLLIKVPLPIMPEPPLPTVPQPPLPEIPSQFINLSYPGPYVVPIRNTNQDTAYKKNTTGKNESPIVGRLPTTSAPSVQDPRWKKVYEDRLAELERKQEEQAKRLMEQERYRHNEKTNYGDGSRNAGSKERINHAGEDSACKGDREKSDEEKQSSSGEEDQSRERYESGEKIITSEEEAKDSEGERHRDYKNDDIYKEDAPRQIFSENYTSIQYNSEPLPLSEDDEQRRPEDLRNSYGEPLFNRELFIDGFANFFGKFRQPFSDIYSSLAPVESKEETPGEEEDTPSEQRDEAETKSDERNREEEHAPARNKYEEYTLEEEDEKKSKESNVESPVKIFNNESNDESRSSFENRETTDELNFDFSKFMPLIVPVRYLSAPDELRNTQLTSEKPEKNDVSRAEASKKVSPKESKRPKKENLKPLVDLTERRTPKKLHETEQKETHVWPPPFDFVFDSTIHTNIVSENPNSNDNVNVSDGRGNSKESESPSRTEDKSQEQKGNNQVTLDHSTQKLYDYPENIYYRSSEKESEYRTVPGKQIIMEDRTTNAEKSNSTNFETEPDHDTMKSNQDSNNGKVAPDFLERYKYISNNNYGIADRPNVGIENVPMLRDSSTLHSKNLESSKRSVERNEQSLESKQQLNVKNRIMHDAPVSQRKFQSTMFFDPMENYNLFDFDGSVYDLNYGRRNERLPGIPEGDKKFGNEERASSIMPQQDAYRYDESLTKFASEPESKAVKVENHANGATIVRMDKRQEMQRRSELEHKMTEILENLKTRLLVE